jgi:uncharacterized membrane protein
MTDMPVTSSRSDISGILWMLTAGLCFVAVNGSVRWLGPALPAAEGAFIRFVFGLIFLIPVLAPALRRGFSQRIWRLLILRGALHVLAVVLWFFAMARITVAEATAIGFLNPVVVTLGAALLMGERISWRRMLAIAVALLGAMIVLRPGLRELQPVGTAAGNRGGGDDVADRLHRAGAAGGAELGAAQPGAIHDAGGDGGFCHGRALRDDAGIRERAADRDPAGDAVATAMGGGSGGAGLWRAGRSLGDDRRRGNDRRHQLYHLARGAVAAGSDYPAAIRKFQRTPIMIGCSEL